LGFVFTRRDPFVSSIWIGTINPAIFSAALLSGWQVNRKSRLLAAALTSFVSGDKARINSRDQG
jgi:hypothetical protein